MSIPLKPFYMIRHGESIANKEGYVAGKLDSALTELGKQQAKDASQYIAKLQIKPAAIVHSNLSRAIDTAHILNTDYNLPMHETNLVAEHDFGEWEKELTAEIRPRFYAGENPPGGETHDEFMTRIAGGLNHALSIDELVLIVCHGGVFRAFYRLYGKIISPVENCKLYHFQPKPADSEFPWDVSLVS